MAAPILRRSNRCPPMASPRARLRVEIWSAAAVPPLSGRGTQCLVTMFAHVQLMGPELCSKPRSLKRFGNGNAKLVRGASKLHRIFLSCMVSDGPRRRLHHGLILQKRNEFLCCSCVAGAFHIQVILVVHRLDDRAVCFKKVDDVQLLYQRNS